MKIIKRILLLVLPILFLILLILWSLNYQLLLLKNNLSDPYLVYAGMDDNKEDMQILMLEREDDITLAHLTKNSFGLWRLEYTVSIENKAYVSLSWSRVTGLKQDENAFHGFVREYHSVICGKNPLKTIAMREEQLPGNTTVGVLQSDSLYMLHVISYNEIGKFERELYDTLRENGFVQ